MSITKDEGLGMALEILLDKNSTDELNNNWNEHIPHLLDYDYTISNGSLRTRIAQDIKKFYFGDEIVSMKTKNDLTKVSSNGFI